jgi:hypothetical protein
MRFTIVKFSFNKSSSSCKESLAELYTKYNFLMFPYRLDIYNRKVVTAELNSDWWKNVYTEQLFV